MDAEERQALWDVFICAAIEAQEALTEALADLRRELIADEEG